MSQRILHITDLHLFKDEETLFWGIPVWKAFREMMAVVNEKYAGADLLVITGDIAHDEERTTYEMVRDELEPWIDRSLFLPGNHENREYLKDVFPERISSEHETIQFETLLNNWRLLGLDTHVPGEDGGRVDDAQLQWLRERLNQQKGDPSLVFMHHHPVPVQCQFLDEIKLMNSEAVGEILEESGNVRAVFSGHVHQEHTGELNRVPVYTTPSACLQFISDLENMEFEPIPPGFRLIELDGADFETSVVRLPQLTFPPGPKEG